MTDKPATAVWPTLIYKDGLPAIKFLKEAFGFEEVALYTSETDPGLVHHAELRWPLGGGIMLGSSGGGSEPFTSRPTGGSAVYVVTDAPDALMERAVAAGAEIVRPIRDEDYGSRGFSARDPEGNYWSFGTYAGE